jgi:hypothetical protein
VTSSLRAAALAFLTLVTGCTVTTVRSGLPPADPAPGFNDRWHVAFLFGTVEASGPYELGQICPRGWSEIRMSQDPFTFLAGAVTLFIYSPSRLDIICAAHTAREEPPTEGYSPGVRPDAPERKMPTAPSPF